MINKIYRITSIFICFLILSSCQKNVIYEDVVFNNSLLNNINIMAEKKEIQVSYVSILNEPFIDYVMETSPTKRVIWWLEDNINHFGTENKLVIDIQNASIVRKGINKEVKVNVAGIVKNQNDYLYELNFKILFLLYDDSDQILATTKVEVSRSTTSSQFISLNESTRILDNLILDSLRDLSNKSIELIKLHMSKYIL